MKMVTPPILEDGKETIREHCVNLERLSYFVRRETETKTGEGGGVVQSEEYA